MVSLDYAEVEVEVSADIPMAPLLSVVVVGLTL